MYDISSLSVLGMDNIHLKVLYGYARGKQRNAGFIWSYPNRGHNYAMMVL